MSRKFSFYSCLLLSFCCFSSLSFAKEGGAAPTNHSTAAVSEAKAAAMQAVLQDDLSRQPIPNHSDINFTQIDADYDIGHYEEALWALVGLQKIHPNNADVWYRLGLLQTAMLDVDAAVDAFRKAILHKLTDRSMAYVRLAELYNDKGRYSQAIEALKEVRRLKPEDAYAWYMLGNVYMSLGRFPESITAFKAAIKIDPTYRQKAFYGQGVSYLRMGDATYARKLFNVSQMMDRTSELGALAKKGVADAAALANANHFSAFGLYGYQFDSNVVLKPSTSPSIPLITGVADFEHTLLAVLSYAPPPSFNGMGYKASTYVYANLHDRLSSFDVVALDFTITPYVAISKDNILSFDTSFGYIFFNAKRYMDTIRFKPSLTYAYSDQLQWMLSVTGVRANYYQSVVLQTSLQDGWTLSEDIQMMLFSKGHQSSVQLGAAFTTHRTRGTDWSYNGVAGNMAVNVAVPYVKHLSVAFNASLERQNFRNLSAGLTQKRKDTIYDASVSLSYPFSYANVSLMASYTHSISNQDVFSYVRTMAGINVSRSF